jgi:uncharacterized membrane protein YqaE (UPF0057 family)
VLRAAAGSARRPARGAAEARGSASGGAAAHLASALAAAPARCRRRRTPRTPTLRPREADAPARPRSKPQKHHGYTGVIIILGFFLPPLAVLARFGVGKDFFINIVCTICGYFPGHVSGRLEARRAGAAASIGGAEASSGGGLPAAGCDGSESRALWAATCKSEQV